MKKQTKTMYAVVIKKDQIFALLDYKYDAENYSVKDYDLKGKTVKKVTVTIIEEE
jgi:hypothetical protein